MVTRIQKQTLIVLLLIEMSIQGTETQPFTRTEVHGFPASDEEHDTNGLAGSEYQKDILYVRANVMDGKYESAGDEYAEHYGQYGDSAKYLANKDAAMPIDIEENGMSLAGVRNEREAAGGTYYGQVSNYFSGVMNSLSNRVAIYSGYIPFYS